MSVFYKISIDHVNANYISGWCHHRFWKNRMVTLQLFSGNRLIDETRCDRFREDLKALNLHPTGNCGFAFSDFQDGRSGGNTLVEIRIKGRKGALITVNHEENRAASVRISRRLKKTVFERRKTKQTAVFMHIPKTAGTSFNTLAQTFYPKGSTINHIELIPTRDYKGLAGSHHYISGHLRYGLLREYFRPEHTAFYTIIREPYRQLHSHLKWMIQTAENPDERFFKATNETICLLGKKLAEIDFSSIRSIETFVTSLEDLEAAFLDNVQTRYFLDDQPSRVVLNDLDTALSNASLFELIGTTEHYDHFVRRFKAVNDIRGNTTLSPLNTSRSALLFDHQDEQMQEILKPLVQYDLLIYERLGGGW